MREYLEKSESWRTGTEQTPNCGKETEQEKMQPQENLHLKNCETATGECMETATVPEENCMEFYNTQEVNPALDGIQEEQSEGNKSENEGTARAMKLTGEN